MRKYRKYPKYLLAIILLFLVVAFAVHYFHGGNKASNTKQAATPGNTSSNTNHNNAAKGNNGKNAVVPVGVASAQTGDISVYLDGLGNIVPRSNVTVHTLVDGELMNVLFREGQMVKKGARLAKIDDRPYAAQLEQAEGLLKRDQALLAEAKIDLKRYQVLWKQDSIAKQQLDTQESLVKQYEGAVINDKGQVDSAKTNLIYTDITSPVNGRVGLRLVDAGNIVHTTDANGIVIVAELQPITAIFSIPEDNIPDVLKHVSAGEKLIAEAWDRDNKNKLATGLLTAVDNQIDPTTGMVKLRAEYANTDNSLFPSQFVNIRLKLTTLKNLVIIPTSAVQRGTHGTFIYLVKPDNTVSVQNIVLGPANGENVAVTSGVNVGDTMVVDGADGLRDGAKIEIANKDPGVTQQPAPNVTSGGANGNAASASPANSNNKPQHQHSKNTNNDKNQNQSQ